MIPAEHPDMYFALGSGLPIFEPVSALVQVIQPRMLGSTYLDRETKGRSMAHIR